MIAKNCNWCNKEYQTKQSYINRGQGLYCSRSCATYANNKKRKPTGKMVNCNYCGKSIYKIQREIKKSKTQKFHCNRKCRGLAEKTSLQHKKSFGNQRRAHLRAKDKLLDIFGVVCQAKECNLDLKNDRRLIDMHHLNDPLDHDNAVLLCPYHHRLVDNKFVFELK